MLNMQMQIYKDTKKTQIKATATLTKAKSAYFPTCLLKLRSGNIIHSYKCVYKFVIQIDLV